MTHFDLMHRILGLSIRTTNCLYEAEINTIEKLLSSSIDELLKYSHFGKKSLNEVRDALSNFSTKLKGENLTKQEVINEKKLIYAFKIIEFVQQRITIPNINSKNKDLDIDSLNLALMIMIKLRSNCDV